MPASAYNYSGQFSTMPPYSTMPNHAVNSNSSAFSVNAQPHEDWTQVSDLAERRRIQNRIAQRNYRKKLKRRLEDLEKRAGSNSASPEPEDPREVSAAAAAAHTHKRASSGSVSYSSGSSSRFSSTGSASDPFPSQRDDGGLNSSHLYTSGRANSSSGLSGLQSWQQQQYAQSTGQHYYNYHSTSSSSSSSPPQFQNPGFVKPESEDDLSQWYQSAAQSPWQSQNQHFSPSQFWDSSNVMLQPNSHYYSR